MIFNKLVGEINNKRIEITKLDDNVEITIFPSPDYGIPEYIIFLNKIESEQIGEALIKMAAKIKC